MKKILLLLISVLCISLAALPSLAASRAKILEELIYRTQQGSAADVMLLIQQYGDANAMDNIGWPILTIAAARTDTGAFDVVKAIIDSGADVNFGGTGQNYPLMLAIQSNNAEIVRFLLDKGANVKVKDGFGMTVLDLSQQAENPAIMDMVQSVLNAELLQYKAERSQENLDKLSYDLAFHSCAQQYFGYYFKSGQDNIPPHKQEETINLHKGAVSGSMGKLMSVFRLEHEKVHPVFETPRAAMHEEMEKMVSNRWRRHQGVGQDGDMENRCARIAEPYKQGVFQLKETQITP